MLGDSGLKKALEEELPRGLLLYFERCLRVLYPLGTRGRGSWVIKEMGVLLRGDSLLPVYEDISLECNGFK